MKNKQKPQQFYQMANRNRSVFNDMIDIYSRFLNSANGGEKNFKSSL